MGDIGRAVLPASENDKEVFELLAYWRPAE